MPREGAQTFSDFLPDFRIEVGCAKCDRKGSYRVSSIMARKGDARLTDFLDDVSADCPKHQSMSIYDQCGARFMNLEEGRKPMT
jgi:hypothetical protein